MKCNLLCLCAAPRRGGLAQETGTGVDESNGKVSGWCKVYYRCLPSLPKNIRNCPNQILPKPTKTGIGGFVTMPLGYFQNFLAPIEPSNSIVSQTVRHHPGGITVNRYISCFIILIATTTALAQTPIPRVGDSCPTGTYTSGDYCKPIKSSSGDTQTIITKTGSKCPTGYRQVNFLRPP